MGVAAWFLSMVQMCFPLIRTIRRSDISEHRFRSQPRICSPSLLDGSAMSTVDMVFTLGDAAGMASLQALTIPYNSGLMNRPYVASDSVFQCILINSLADQMIQRIFMSCIMENCLQINLQSTLYAADIAACRLRGVKDHVQVRTLVSISLSIGMSLLKLLDVRDFQKMVKEITAGMEIAGVEGNAACLRFQESTRPKLRLLFWGCALIVLSLLFAAVTTVMAHVCKDSMWNTNGCVSLRAQSGIVIKTHRSDAGG